MFWPVDNFWDLIIFQVQRSGLNLSCRLQLLLLYIYIQNGLIFNLKNKILTEQREIRADLSWYYLK